MDPFEDRTTEDRSRLELELVLQRQRPRLTWSDDNGPRAVELEGHSLLGSSSRAGVFVADRTVSRVHAELVVQGDGVWVRDLGSRNGTWIGNTLVKHALVPLGGAFRVGATQMVLSVDEAPTRVRLWPHDQFGPLVGRSEVMRELFMRLSEYAATDEPVLIQGETGTGKELVAQSVHDASARSAQPLVVVDCAALPETLLEGELFGHTRGAFTGAVASRAGAFEAADGGTVFLDEIGELPLSMQPKLLRVLETRMVRRLGQTELRKVDVRFIAATHRDLQALVAAGAFREDLYFRLAVLPVYVPPLRERPEDVGVLLQRFLEGTDARLSSELLEELSRHVWQGNVRELRSFARRASALTPATAWAMTRGLDASPVARATPSGPPPPLRAATGLPPVAAEVPFKVLREQWNDHLEREYLRALLTKHGHNVANIAQDAELDATYVRRLLRKHDL